MNRVKKKKKGGEPVYVETAATMGAANASHDKPGRNLRKW